jgi:hypothetical protein
MDGTTVMSSPLVGKYPGPSWHVVGVEDVNGDGKSDIVWQNNSGQAAIWLMNGTTVTATPLVGRKPGLTWHVKGG